MNEAMPWQAARAEAAIDVRRATRVPSLLERSMRAGLMQRLSGLRTGSIVLCDAQGEHAVGAKDGGEPIRIHVRDPRLYVDVATQGSVGAGGAYADGLWTCDDLVALTRLFVRERDVLGALDRGFARLGMAALRWWHSRRDNTVEGSRENIAAHYDLGNDFYELFLDPTMMYSCAIYERDGMTLEEAQVARLRRIGKKLELGPNDRVLEIGTGWGGMAIHVAREHGCHVTTTTISREQHRYTLERVRAAGLESRVTVLLEDYRKLTGTYDKLVSLEMVEAVGERWLDTYFESCSRLLTPHGTMLLQAITIQDQHYEAALRSVDFIQRHVFPGSFIPSIGAIADRVTRKTDLKLYHLEDIGPHYARTLAAWRERLLARRDEVAAVASERLLRLFDFYFAYCEGGFEERALGTVQIVLTKPGCRRGPIVPAFS